MGFWNRIFRPTPPPSASTDSLQETVQVHEQRLAELEAAVAQQEVRLSAQEALISQMLNGLGDYKTRSREELTLMQAQLSSLLKIAEGLVQIADTEAGKERAKGLIRRVRYNLTRARNVSQQAA